MCTPRSELERRLQWKFYKKWRDTLEKLVCCSQATASRDTKAWVAEDHRPRERWEPTVAHRISDNLT